VLHAGKFAYCSKACQAQAWKSKHKQECARRASELTAHQLKVIHNLEEQYGAQLWQGVVALKAEASEVAADVRTSHPSMAAQMYAMLGCCHRQVQHYQDAIGLFNTAMPIYEDIRKDELAANHKTDDRRHLCNVCCDLATCYRNTGSLERALVLYDRALAIGEEAGDRQVLGRVMRDMGALYQLLGQHDRAIELLVQGSAIANEVGDRKGQVTSCGNLARCYKAMGQYEKAFTLGEQSAVIYEELGDIRSLMVSVIVLAECVIVLGECLHC
jgi:tetratricopeptide (TPR) repeat protein